MTTITLNSQAAPPPHGFEPVDLGGTFATANGPLFARWYGERLTFSQGLIHADGELVMRASGVFRRGPLLPESADDQALWLPGMPQRG